MLARAEETAAGFVVSRALTGPGPSEDIRDARLKSTKSGLFIFEIDCLTVFVVLG